MIELKEEVVTQVQFLDAWPRLRQCVADGVPAMVRLEEPPQSSLLSLVCESMLKGQRYD